MGLEKLCLYPIVGKVASLKDFLNVLKVSVHFSVMQLVL